MITSSLLAAIPPTHRLSGLLQLQRGRSGAGWRLVLLALALMAGAVVAGCGASAAPAGAGATRGAVSSPPLRTASTFAVLAGQAVTNTGPTTIAGDLGVSPGTAVTGFPPGLVSGGTTHAADAVALQAQADLTASYLDLAGLACEVDSTGVDLAGRTLAPGVYCFSSSAQLSGDLVLDAQGRSDAVFVFQIGSTLITASGSSVRMINGGEACQVFWQVGSSATLGTGSAFVGSILALTSVDLATGATVSGRVAARNGSVTLDDNRIAIGTCGGGCLGSTCDGQCVDTGVDEAHCGACGVACATGTTCTEGVCGTTAPPECRDLGQAAAFDVFTLGPFDGHGGSVEGAIAVGGDFTAVDYAIGGGLPGGALALLIGNDLRFTTGTVHGNVIYGGDLCWICDVVVSGTVTRGTLIDFVAAGAYLLGHSTWLAALPATGTTSLVDGVLTLAGTDPAIDVFTVPAAVLSGARTVEVRVPDGAHVVLNVTGGGTVALTAQTWNLNGLPTGRLLVNFPEAAQLDLTGTSLAATLLAPLAAVRLDDGLVTGQIIAASYAGQGQVGWSPYDACVPAP